MPVEIRDFTGYNSINSFSPVVQLGIVVWMEEYTRRTVHPGLVGSLSKGEHKDRKTTFRLGATLESPINLACMSLDNAHVFCF